MKIKNIVYGAITAAIYVALTMLVLPLSSGLIQVRFSEALCVLPYFFGFSVPGLFVGCLLSNLLAGCVAVDVIFGSIATLIAALTTYWLGRRGGSRFLAPLPAVLINAVIVGMLLFYAYDIGAPLIVCMAYVGAGQLISCYVLGMPLLALLEKFKGKIAV